MESAAPPISTFLQYHGAVDPPSQVFLLFSVIIATMFWEQSQKAVEASIWTGNLLGPTIITVIFPAPVARGGHSTPHRRAFKNQQQMSIKFSEFQAFIFLFF